jgi:GPH family glycoside/pentoside/hexuronide:cation symporter
MPADAIAAACPTDSRTWRIRIGSLLIPFAHAAGMNTVTVLGLRFLTDSLAISAGLAGTIFALVKIYDGLLDPAVGAWSDRVSSHWGRRLPFLFAGGLVMPLGLAMLFGTPGLGSILLSELFITLALAVHATGFTLLTIPGFAMVVEASGDHHERTRLMAWRVYGNSGGTLIGTTIPAWLLSQLGTGRGAHLAMALTIGAVVLAASLTAVWLLRDAPRTVPDPDSRRYGLGRQVRLVWANMPFRILAIAHIFLLFGTAIGSAGMAYFSRYVLKAGDGWLGTYFLISTIAAVAATPVWVRLSARIGKRTSYMTAMAIYGAMHLAWLTAAEGEASAALSLRAIMIGIAAGGMILCAYALLSDAVRYDYVHTGERREGAFAGFTTLFDKLSAALALAAMGWFLAVMGYVSSGAGAATAQGEGAVLAIRICVGIIPALSMLGAIATVSRYDLDPATLVEPVGV